MNNFVSFLYGQLSAKHLLLLLSSLLSPFSSFLDCYTATIKPSEHDLLLNEISHTHVHTHTRAHTVLLIHHCFLSEESPLAE